MRLRLTLLLLLLLCFALPAYATDTALIDRDGVTTPLVLTPANLGAATAAHTISSVQADGKTIQQSPALNIVGGGLITKSASGVLSLEAADSGQVVNGGAFTKNTKFGVNDVLLYAYASQNYEKQRGSGGGWQTGFGNVDNEALNRIDYAFKRMHEMGVKWYREVSPMPVLGPGWGPSGGTVTPLDTDGWEAVDRVVKLGRMYDIKIIFCIPAPYYSNTNYKTVSSYINNWATPLATYYATRYKNDTDIVTIEPVNEINGLFLTRFTDAVNGTGVDPRWVDLQTAIYDAVKAAAPRMTVTMSSVSEWTSGDAAKTINILGQMNSAGKMSKFDGYFGLHFYADPELVISPNYYANPAIPSGAGTYADIATVKAALNSYGRSDALVSVGEFSVVWDILGRVSTVAGSPTVTGTNTTFLTGVSVNGLFNNKLHAGNKIRLEGDQTIYTIASVVSETQLTLTTNYPTTRTQVGMISNTVEERCASALQWIYNQAASDTNVANVMYWALYGSEQSDVDANSSAIIPSGLGYKGWGLVLADTDAYTLPGKMLRDMAKGGNTQGSQRIIARSGLSTEIPAAADLGEFLFETDTNKLKIGKGPGVAPILLSAKVDGTAYNATSWDGNTDAPTKDAVRDKIESMTGSFGEANTASNVGTGAGTVFKAKVNADLQMKTIKAGSNITITNNTDDITIASTAAGTGDVTGPATNTDGYVPLWSGANSKALKNGLPVNAYGANTTLLATDSNGATIIKGGNLSPSITLQNDSSGSTARFPNFTLRNFYSSSTGFPNVSFYNDGGTGGAPASTASGEVLGGLYFGGYHTEGTPGEVFGGTFSFLSEGAFTDVDQPTAFKLGLGKIGGNGAVSTKLYINGSGVGGTTLAGGNLDLISTSHATKGFINLEGLGHFDGTYGRLLLTTNAAIPATSVGSKIHIIGENTVAADDASMQQYMYSTSSAFGSTGFFRARGSNTSPLKVLSGDRFGGVAARGYYGVAGSGGSFPSGGTAAMFYNAEEDFNDSTHLGTRITFETTATASGTRTEKFRISGSGMQTEGLNDYTASFTVANSTSSIVLASGTATATLPKTLPAGSTSVLVTVSGAAASGVSFAAESGGSISWGDAGSPTFTNSKTADVVCISENSSATTTAAWRCAKGGNF